MAKEKSCEKTFPETYNIKPSITLAAVFDTLFYKFDNIFTGLDVTVATWFWQRELVLRMLRQHILKLGLFIIAVGVHLPAHAMPSPPTLKAKELQASCRELDQQNGQLHSLCQFYVQGFLDASASGVNLEPKNTRSTLKQRALRTRADGLVERSTAYKEGAYCLPQSITPQDLAAAIARSEPLVGHDTNVGELMQRVLRNHFPCP